MRLLASGDRAVMCRDVISEDCWSPVQGRNQICDGLWGGFSDSLRCFAVRTGLDSVGDPEAARIANLLSRRILVLKTHSLILVSSAVI